MRKFMKCLAGALALLFLVGVIPVAAKPMASFVPQEYVPPERAYSTMNIIEDGQSE